jgi:glycosyltransferase involved in cell wall biosynthesis
MRAQVQALKIDSKVLPGESGEAISIPAANAESLSISSLTLSKISLIVPVLQEEKILADTLSKYSGKLKKKYNIELIVSDGGSIDKTLDIAKKYSNIVIEHNDIGKQLISKGRNLGAEAASGDVLVFMNGDTFPADVDKFFSFVSEWASGSSKYEDCFGLTCWVTIQPEELLIKDRIFYAVHNRYIRFLNFIGLGMGRGECQIIRKEYFKQIGGYDDNLAAGEDFDLFRRLAKIGKIGFVQDLKVYESPRRFRKYGYFRIIMSWIYNSLSVMFYGKSISDDWEPVR